MWRFYQLPCAFVIFSIFWPSLLFWPFSLSSFSFYAFLRHYLRWSLLNSLHLGLTIYVFLRFHVCDHPLLQRIHLNHVYSVFWRVNVLVLQLLTRNLCVQFCVLLFCKIKKWDKNYVFCIQFRIFQYLYLP